MEDDEITLEPGASYEEATFRDGCLSLRAAVLERQRAAASPGPKYHMPDGLGTQVLSTLQTTPIIGFAQADKDRVGRPVEHLNAREVPGPQYQLDQITYGRQVESRRKTAPMPSFGSSTRRPLRDGEACSPGPMTALPRVINPNVGPTIAGAPWRDRRPSGGDTPAPNQYAQAPALGTQVLSTRVSANPISFGGAGITREMAKPGANEEPGPGSYDSRGVPTVKNVSFGSALQRPKEDHAEGPGPNQYGLPSALGPQVWSRYTSTPVIGFGKPRPKSAKTRLPGAETPAPGQYQVDNAEAAFGFRINSKERSVPGVKFSTGAQRPKENEEARKVPGPQSYDPDQIRRAVLSLSNKKAITGVKFGTGPQRYNDIDNTKQPGPQAYDPSNIRQALLLCKKSNLINIKFGNATKREAKPRAGPAPNEYNLPSAMGQQVSSIFKSASAPSFGSGSQRHNDLQRGSTPGPQSYQPSLVNKPKSIIDVRFGTGPQRMNERFTSGPTGIKMYHLPPALGRQVRSQYKSQPAFSLGAR